MAGRSPKGNAGAFQISSVEELEEYLRLKRGPNNVLVEHVELCGSTNHSFWHRIVMSAVPQDPVRADERQGKTHTQVQEMVDRRRFIIVACGKKAGEVIEGALQHQDPSSRISQEQLQYISVEDFK